MNPAPHDHLQEHLSAHSVTTLTHSLVLGQCVRCLGQTLTGGSPNTSCWVSQAITRAGFHARWVHTPCILGSIADEFPWLRPALDLGCNGLHAHGGTGSDTATVVPCIAVTSILADDLH